METCDTVSNTEVSATTTTTKKNRGHRLSRKGKKLNPAETKKKKPSVVTEDAKTKSEGIEALLVLEHGVVEQSCPREADNDSPISSLTSEFSQICENMSSSEQDIGKDAAEVPRCETVRSKEVFKCDSDHEHAYFDSWFGTENDAAMSMETFDKFCQFAIKTRKDRGRVFTCHRWKDVGCPAKMRLREVVPREGKTIGLSGCLSHNHKVDINGKRQMLFYNFDEGWKFYEEKLFDSTIIRRKEGHSIFIWCKFAVPPVKGTKDTARRHPDCPMKFAFRPFFRFPLNKDTTTEVHTLEGIYSHNHDVPVRDKRILVNRLEEVKAKLLLGVPVNSIFAAQEIPVHECEVTERPVQKNHIHKLKERLVGRHMVPGTNELEGVLRWLKDDFVQGHSLRGLIDDSVIDAQGLTAKRLETEEFLIFMMSDRQREILREHPKTLMGDATHGTNQAGLELVSFHVLVRNGQSFPVCHGLVETENKNVIEAMFRKLIELEPEAMSQVEVLISDLSHSYRLAWEACKLQKVRFIACGWHFEQVCPVAVEKIFLIH